MQLKTLRRWWVGWDMPFLLILLLPVVFVFYGSQAPGYLFTLDSIFTPNYNIFNLDSSYDSLVIRYMLYLAAKVINQEVLQVIYWSICIYLPSVLTFRYAKLHMSKKAALASALFLTLNPFIYQRLVAGHFHLVLSLGLLLPYLHNLVANGWQRNYKLFLINLLGAIITPHFLWYLVMINACYLLLGFKIKKIDFVPFMYLSLIATAMYAMFTFSAISRPSDLLMPFYSRNILDLVVLEGMWIQTEGIASSIFQVQPLAQIVLWIGIYLFVVTGTITALKYRKNNISIILVLSGLVGLLLACLSIKEFSPVYAFLYNIPGFGVMREGHKWLGLYVVMLSWSFGMGLDYILRKTIRWRLVLNVAAFSLIPILGLPMYFLANGQIGQYEYPESWQKLDSLAGKDPNDAILALPWTGYDEYTFLEGQYIANPAGLYFKNTVVASRFAHNMNNFNDCDIQDNDFCVSYESPKMLWDDFLKSRSIKYVLIINTENEGEIAVEDLQGKIDYAEIYMDDYSTFIVLK